MILEPWMRDAQPRQPVPKDLTPRQIRLCIERLFVEHMTTRKQLTGNQTDLGDWKRWSEQLRALFKEP